MYHCKHPEKPIVFLFGRTGISAINVGGNAIHSALGIEPRTKLFRLNDKPKAEIFAIISEKAFAGLSVMTATDLLQLPPVRRKLLLTHFSDKYIMKHLLGLQLWHLFKYAELTEVVRENDKLFIDLLNKLRLVNIDDDVEKLLKARFIHEFDENYPKDTFHMYPKNEPAMKRNGAVLNNLLGKLYAIKANNDKIQDNCKYPLTLIEAHQNEKQTSTGGLTKFLRLKIGAKVIITVQTEQYSNRTVNSTENRKQLIEH